MKKIESRNTAEVMVDMYLKEPVFFGTYGIIVILLK